MVDMIATTVEGVVLLAAVLAILRLPRFTALLAAALAFAARGRLFGPSVRGADILGRETMRAAVYAAGEEHGVTLASVAVPDHLPHEVLVKVSAAGLNPSNFKIRFDRIPFLRHYHGGAHVVGYDVAGVAESVGSDALCEGFAVGETVFGFAGGSIAEYAVISCGAAAHAPKTISSAHTAGLPVVALTSLMAWERGGLRRGDKALVIGASGGCGIFGVSMGKLIGAEVTGICSTKNVAFVRSLGADKVVDYRNVDELEFLERGGRQFNVIYDTVSSFAPEDPASQCVYFVYLTLRRSPLQSARACLRASANRTFDICQDYEPRMRPLLLPGGRYVAINGAPLDWVRGALSQFILVPFFGMSAQRAGYDLFLLTPQREALERLAAWIDAGELEAAPLDASYTLESKEQIHAAFKNMKSRRTVGKIVFVP